VCVRMCMGVCVGGEYVLASACECVCAGPM
jgi:hypothetical protein